MGLAQEKMDILGKLKYCRNWIESALAYSGGTHEYMDIVDGVISGHMQLWMGESGCAVTEITVYPKKKVLHVFLAAGDMDQIKDFEASAAEFAKQNGCDAMTVAGRPGWKKVLGKRGWRESFVVLEREI
jgi:hypothetical protein